MIDEQVDIMNAKGLSQLFCLKVGEKNPQNKVVSPFIDPCIVFLRILCHIPPPFLPELGQFIG